MTITAKIIADSISPAGIRLVTMQWRYPKFIHGEVMTHRVFSRNASSSRAIPVERMIQDVIDDPAMPVFWGRNQKGMQAVEELTDYDRGGAIIQWLKGRDEAVRTAQRMITHSVHKQIVNRIIEPWCHINTLVSSTEWANFDALRMHKDAQPEMRALAEAAYAAREQSIPVRLYPGQWHLPYVDPSRDVNLLPSQSPYALRIDNGKWFTDLLIKISVARCARVSYMTHEGKPPNIDDDLALYERLVGSTPLHASPAEHQATPDGMVEGIGVEHGGWQNWDQHGNFAGWRQYRKMLPNEYVADR